ncbi:hypothetical protein DEDE109153_09355 [Deinococcus deserti]
MKVPLDSIPVHVLLNLIEACMGCIVGEHQAIVISYDEVGPHVELVGYLSSSTETALEQHQEIADELEVRLNYSGIAVRSQVVINHQGVLKLSESDRVFFLRYGFEILTFSPGSGVDPT